MTSRNQDSPAITTGWLLLTYPPYLSSYGDRPDDSFNHFIQATDYRTEQRAALIRVCC